jgi:hypothetical protein
LGLGWRIEGAEMRRNSAMPRLHGGDAKACGAHEILRRSFGWDRRVEAAFKILCLRF